MVSSSEYLKSINETLHILFEKKKIKLSKPLFRMTDKISNSML